MNSRQKELLSLSVKKEKRILAQIKKVYLDSLKEVEEKIKLLQADELTQSKIYQLEHQQVLKGQISTIIERLEDKQYQSINEYLKDKYNDGFVGTMYDLHGQGVPLIFPIDEEDVVKALLVDTKLSEGLYKRLNKDIKIFKRQIQNEISRGISSSFSFGDIARNLRNRSNVPINNAYRIARTEGHRISEESSRNARLKAKENGADVVKQWDSTGDRRTRKNHIELDGQIREIEENFEIAGHSASEPGHFGIASEDINCRCVSLTRAKWALDDEELEKLKDKAEYFELDKIKDFEDFKGKYQSAVEVQTKVDNLIKSGEKIDLYKLTDEEYGYLMSKTIIRSSDEVSKTTINDKDLDLISKHFNRKVKSLVILREERLEHILEGHKDIGENLIERVMNAVNNPKVILEDYKNSDTIMFIGKNSETNVNVIVKLSFNENLENSIITAFRISEKRLNRLIKKNKKIK